MDGEVMVDYGWVVQSGAYRDNNSRGLGTRLMHPSRLSHVCVMVLVLVAGAGEVLLPSVVGCPDSDRLFSCPLRRNLAGH